MKQDEQETGRLFGKLFPAYDKQSFDSSMELFARRFQANDFPLDWFQGKNCLDVGCGGGRYTMAMAKLGATHCTGIDIGENSIVDARKRASAMNLTDVNFEVTSATSLPYIDGSFDCVIFSGVLQHLAEPVTALSEISRVLRSGGMFYTLVYATEGVRWPLVQMLRPIAKSIGFEAMDKAVEHSGLSVAKRRTYLDDLFVPFIDFYSWQCLSNLLNDKSFTNVKRWNNGRLDHEENLNAYLKDLEGFHSLFRSAAKSLAEKDKLLSSLALQGQKICERIVEYVREIAVSVEQQEISEDAAKTLVIGQGHHRVVAWKK